ncbi:lactococcin family bacteriocin, partial [uncultured Leuconostoc sp.]
MNYQNYKKLSDSELSEVNGGLVPVIIGGAVGLY